MPASVSFFSAIHWQTFRRVPISKLPYSQRAWVLDRGSLTKRLIQASSGDFQVQIGRQVIGIPRLDEQRCLQLPTRRRALIREVNLICKSEVWVKARSVIPLSTLTGPERQLAYLGNRPLGAFLFRAKTMRRGPLQIGSYKVARYNEGAARRSIFYLHNKPLLVSEFFLENVFRINKDQT